MTPENRLNIRRNYPELVDFYKTRLLDICNVLDERGLITTPMKNAVLSKPTEDCQASAFLDLIQKRGPDAYEILYQVSKELKFYGAADILRPENGPHEPNDDGYDEMETDTAGQGIATYPWPSSEYIENAQNMEVFVEKVTNKKAYYNHIGKNDIFYQMTAKRGRPFLLYDDENEKPLLKDRMFLNNFLDELNFNLLKVQLVASKKEFLDLKTEPGCCLLLFIFASKFFKGSEGLKLIKQKLYSPQLENVPKVVFRYEKESECDKIGVAESNDFSLKLKSSQKTPTLPNDGPVSGDTHDGPSARNSHDGPTTARDADILIFDATDFGNEVVSCCGVKLTRFVHVIIDVFAKHAKTDEFIDLLGKVNGRTEEMVGILRNTTIGRKLYFFPGCFQENPEDA